MTNISSQKRMAAEILKCGVTRIKVSDTQSAKDAIDEALTREDVRGLIRKKYLIKKQVKGQSSAGAKKIKAQKKKGRRKGKGSRKGNIGARESKKKKWVKSVRALRVLIKDLRDTGRLERSNYRLIYRRVKGGMFRNRKHIMLYLKEHELLKTRTKIIKKLPKKPVAKKAPVKEKKKELKPVSKDEKKKDNKNKKKDKK